MLSPSPSPSLSATPPPSFLLLVALYPLQRADSDVVIFSLPLVRHLLDSSVAPYPYDVLTLSRKPPIPSSCSDPRGMPLCRPAKVTGCLSVHGGSFTQCLLLILSVQPILSLSCPLRHPAGPGSKSSLVREQLPHAALGVVDTRARLDDLSLAPVTLARHSHARNLMGLVTRPGTITNPFSLEMLEWLSTRRLWLTLPRATPLSLALPPRPAYQSLVLSCLFDIPPVIYISDRRTPFPIQVHLSSRDPTTGSFCHTTSHFDLGTTTQ